MSETVLTSAVVLIKLFFGAGIALLCAAALSCNVISFENLDIGMSVGADDVCWSGEKLLVDFSIEPERASFEKILTLEKNGATLSFDMEGAASRFALCPVEGWKNGSVYRLVIDGTISMKDGRNYTAHETRHFMYGSADGLLRLVRPPQENLTSLDDVIAFHFSKPVVHTAFKSAFSISPNSNVRFSFKDGGRLVLIKPTEQWPLNTTLEWKLDTKLYAEDGYVLDKKYEGVTRTIFDVDLPRLVSVCPAQKNGEKYSWSSLRDLNSIIEKQAIVFTFSKPMDAQSVADGITFEPNIKGAFFALGEDGRISALDEDCMIFIFEPYTNYEIETEYKVCVGKSCASENGLALYEDEFRFFKSANEYLIVESINVCGKKLPVTPLKECGKDLPDCESVKTVVAFEARGGADEKDSVKSTRTPIKSIRAKIKFSTAIGEAQRLQAEKAVSCAALFPANASSPQPVLLEWDMENTLLRVEWDGVSASDTDGNHYQIIITGGKNGLVNVAGEYLKEDVCVTFIVRESQDEERCVGRREK